MTMPLLDEINSNINSIDATVLLKLASSMCIFKTALTQSTSSAYVVTALIYQCKSVCNTDIKTWTFWRADNAQLNQSLR